MEAAAKKFRKALCLNGLLLAAIFCLAVFLIGAQGLIMYKENTSQLMFVSVLQGIVVSSGTSIGLSSAIETGSIFKSAIAVKTGDYGFVHDEMPSPVTSASTQVPPVVTTLALGVPYGTGNPDHSFIISRLTYYPERVSDESLEALTS